MLDTIRPEAPADVAAIHRVLLAAFPGDGEARIVAALRASGNLRLSLVAESTAGIVGHIAFSPVTVTRDDRSLVSGIGLAPMAVLPERQRSGVGGRLIAEGLRRLRADGVGFCVVLGHPDYYPRFGFTPASRHGMRWELPAPDPAFMVIELAPGGLAGVSGVVRYRPEIMAAVPLRSGRLRLRPWSAGDVAELHALVVDEHVRRHLLDGEVVSREWVEDQLRRSEQQFAARGLGLWTARTPDGALVGFAGFMPPADAADPTPELVVAITGAHARAGHGLEISRAVLAQAHDRGHRRIRASTDVANVASQRLLARLGFVPAEAEAPGPGAPLLHYVLVA